MINPNSSNRRQRTRRLVNQRPDSLQQKRPVLDSLDIALRNDWEVLTILPTYPGCATPISPLDACAIGGRTIVMRIGRSAGLFGGIGSRAWNLLGAS
jgi:hypothetical protein